MTNYKAIRQVVAVMAAALFVAGCSGNGSGSGGGAAPRAATLRGQVQGFSGGLQVNGVAFRTTGAHLRLPDDSPSPMLLETEDAVKGHLDDGMVVTVHGILDDNGGTGGTGEATEIEFHDSMEAAIDDKGPGRIRLLGEDLSFDDSTKIVDRHGNPLTPDDLTVGTRVEVSGEADSRGHLRASFIRVRDDVAAGVEREAKGYVIAISGSVIDLAFTKGGPLAMRADLSGIALPPSLAVGDLVEVKTMGPPDASGILAAVAVSVENELEPEHGDVLRVEGIVTAVDASGFDLAGQRVTTDASTHFRGGTVDDLVAGAKLEAEGTLGNDGILHASEIEFEALARIDANVGAVDAPAMTVALLGITVHVSPSTELRSFASLADLNADDRIEVRGNPTKDGLGVNATRIERLSTSPNDRAFLRAIASAKTPNTGLTILGIAVDASAASFRNAADQTMDAASFFGAITPGQTVVKVRWRPYPASTAEPIDEAELEN